MVAYGVVHILRMGHVDAGDVAVALCLLGVPRSGSVAGTRDNRMGRIGEVVSVVATVTIVVGVGLLGSKSFRRLRTDS